MRRLIRADIRRFLAKPSFYVVLAAALALTVLNHPADSAGEQIEMYKSSLGTLYLFLVSMPVFLGIYGDEIKSGVRISAIGRGIHRKKIVMAKLCDVAIIMLGCFILAFVLILVRNSFTDLAITPSQNLMLFVYCIFCVIRSVGYFALASLVVFLSWSSASGLFVLIVYSLILNMVLKGIQTKFTVPVYDISFDGLMDEAYAHIQVGQPGICLIAAVIIYICLVVYLTNKFFKRKELAL
ncbi:MAG: hypothetical protein K6G58_06165 [Lachnospiraceae bacterium]|nr:hypothetical protein [Lachnospiraceae bacterium]